MKLWAIALTASCVAILATMLTQFALTQAYAIDEFYYTHKSWRVVTEAGYGAEEALHGRSFVTSWLFAPIVALADNNPARMIWLRYLTAPLALLSIAGIAFAAAQTSPRRRDMVAAGLVTAIAMMQSKLFTHRVVEIRPDLVALLFTATSLALTVTPTRRPRSAAALAGCCLFAACFASRKAMVYGLAFGAVFWIDVIRRAPAGRAILRHPWWFLCGLGACTAILATAVIMLADLRTFWDGLYGLAAIHERDNPRVPLARTLEPLLRKNIIFHALAAIGVVTAVVRTARWRLPRHHLLLLLLLVSTWASHVMQQAPHRYSMLPGIAMESVFAAHGAVLLLAPLQARFAVAGPRIAYTILTIAAIGHTVRGFRSLEPSFTNPRQIELHTLLHELTAPTDPVYDQSACYVFRPRGHRLEFIDPARYIREYDALMHEVPVALVERGVPLFLCDIRYDKTMRGTELDAFIQRNYQRYNDDFHIWGRRWNGHNEINESYRAIRDGRYFVFPDDAISSGQLQIDGERVNTTEFALSRGPHAIEWSPGLDAPDRLYILWLPRNGEHFDPSRPSPRYELGRYYLP